MGKAPHFAANKQFTSANPVALIARIDRKIDAVRRELRCREKINLQSAGSWQAAWNLHPDLQRRHNNLFWLRGEFQIHRNRQDREREMRAARSARPRKPNACKTCGGSGFAPAEQAAS